MRASFLLLVLVPFVLVGCTTQAEKTERAATIAAMGHASIEGIKTVGPAVTHLFVLKIDGVLVQGRGSKGVYPLTPGPHAIQVQCNFGRMPIGGLVIDAGGTVLQVDAVAGGRYRLAGKKLSVAQAELWIDDVATGARVSAIVPVPLEANRQEVPAVPIYIPAAR